jgi:hypothetical protein
MPYAVFPLHFYFDEDREAHVDTVLLFKDIADGKYEAFTSDYVIDELRKAPPKKYARMMGLLTEYGIAVLRMDDDADRLADVYVAKGIIPAKYRTDGLHIAIAAVNNLDMIVSMNFQHIVKRKTKIATGSINALNGYRAVEIYSPMEVVDNEDY